jgi:hypothetical protein
MHLASATAEVRSDSGAALELTVEIAHSDANEIAKISLKNSGQRALLLGNLDPYVWLRDVAGTEMVMTDYGKSHFFNLDKAGSVFSNRIGPGKTQDWNCDLQRCFRVPVPGTYLLEVEYSPTGSGPENALPAFGLDKIPVRLR